MTMGTKSRPMGPKKGLLITRQVACLTCVLLACWVSPVLAQDDIDWEVVWDISYRPNPPTLRGVDGDVVTAESLGDGWYRVSLSATPADSVLAFIHSEVRGIPNGFVECTFTRADGTAFVSRFCAGETPLGTMSLNEAFSTRIDGVDSGGDVFREVRNFSTPTQELALQYFIDVGSDGTYELAGGGQGSIDIWMPGAAQVVVASGFVRHPPNGESASFGGPIPLPNEAPTLLETRVIDVDQENFGVVLALDGIDADGDTLTYRVEWGDGNESISDGRFAQHTYAAGFNAYAIRVTVTDHRGESDSTILPVEFSAPAPNQRPEVNEVSLVTQNGHDVVVLVAASDADADALQYEVEWGDGESSQGISPIFRHTYGAGLSGPMTVSATASDGQDTSPAQTLALLLEAPEANQGPQFQGAFWVEKDGFEVVIGLQARDPNGDDLTFSIDWNDGGPIEQSAGPFVRHRYPENVYRLYVLTLTVSDPSGETDQRQLSLEFHEPDANLAPVIEGVAEISRDGLSVQLLATAEDPDGSEITYTFNWGDASAETIVQGGLAEHEYTQFGRYNVRVTATDEDGASDEIVYRVDFPEPAVNRAPSLDVLEVIRQTDFIVAVAAGGSDPDGDDLTYTIDWGDLSLETINTAGVGQHVYPDGIFDEYEITVTVRDGRGGEASGTLDVSFEAPPANTEPAIELVHIIEQSGFDITLAVSASDADNDQLTYRVDWGDGTSTESQGGVIRHSFPDGVFQNYVISVLVQDGRGAFDDARVEVSFDPPPANQVPVLRGITLVNQDGFMVVVHARAQDTDDDPLTFTFDWGDGSDSTSQASGLAAHVYPVEYGVRQLTVTVSDGRGGFDSQVIPVTFDPPPDNEAPEILFTEVIDRDGRTVTLAIDAQDPDGDELTYTFDWGDGTDADVTGGGVASHRYAPEQVGVVTAQISVNDGRGGEAVTTVEFEFDAPDPNQVPVFEFVQVIERDQFAITVAAHGVDPDGDALMYSFDWGDGSDPSVQNGGVAQHTYPTVLGQQYTVTVTVTDTEGAQDVNTLEIDFPAPEANHDPVFDLVNEINRDGLSVTLAASATDPDGDPVEYDFAWNDGQPSTVTAGGVAAHTFADYGSYLVVVTASDGRGGVSIAPILVEFEAPAPNLDPVVETLRLVKQGDFTVSAFVGAHDDDGDDLSFEFNWGDGTDPQRRETGVAAYQYPENVFREYTVTVTVDDGRGGRHALTAVVDFPHPEPNQAPDVNELDVDVGVRGHVYIQATHHDAEGHVVEYSVHWGDEADDEDMEPLPGGDGTHVYALPEDGQPYVGFVRATDEEGATTDTPFVVQIEDRPTLIRQVNVEPIEDGTVRFTVEALDQDGADLLTYAFDFDNDGGFEIDNAVSSTALHHYPNAGAHEYRVRVTESWSGQSVEADGVVVLDEWVVPNAAPSITGLRIEGSARGEATLVVQAADPEGHPLTYAVHWGDEEDENSVSALVGGQATHAYAYRADGSAYAGFVRVTDALGVMDEREFAFVVQDHPTLIRSARAELMGDGRYSFSIVAEDSDSPNELFYHFDFDGDGEWDISDSAASQHAHQYQRPGDYQVEFRVTDGWSGEYVQQLIPLRVEPWIQPNALPVLDGFEIQSGPRGHTQIRLSSRDPDGGSLRHFIRWGDELDLGAELEFVGNVVEHSYAYQGGQSYRGQVRIVDEHGAEAVHIFNAAVEDSPTDFRRFEAERIREGTWLMRIDAMDPDAAGDLAYAFDFESDGVWDVEQLPGPQVVHTFEGPGPYPVQVRVTDEWSGTETSAVYIVGSDREGTPNLPPELVSFDLQIGAGGAAELRVDARDPENGLLTVEVAWGDTPEPEFEGVVSGQANHTYIFPENGDAYDGVVRMTDEAGLTTEHEFVADVVDQPTQIDQIALTVVRNGTVLMNVAATDPDSDELLYAFDMNGDGLFESTDMLVGDYLHEYAGGGTYTVRVVVTDPWSGISEQSEQVLVLEPWLRSAPFADDHLEGEEGRCLVLRVARGRVTSETGPSVCERDVNPNADEWRWDFGDGTVARGSEVGHIYEHDGIYSVTVTGGTVSQPIESIIEVLVVNVAPQFVTEPPETVESGNIYYYTVELTDQGPQDELELELNNAPEDMRIERVTDRSWQLVWDVPLESAGLYEIELMATDGRTIDGEWRPDGGRTIQRYRLEVSPTIIPDAGLPEPDAYRPSFDEIKGDKLGCMASQPGDVSLLAIILFLSGLAIRRRRRL